MRYGLDLTYSELLPEGKLMETVNTLKGKDTGCYDQIMREREKEPDVPFGQFFGHYLEDTFRYRYKDNDYHPPMKGVAAFVGYLVFLYEGISLSVVGKTVGILGRFPWDYPENLKGMSYSDFAEMMKTYAGMVTEGPFDLQELY